MKYSIITLLFFALMSCHELRQEEEASSYNDFFMKRSESAKSIKDQNYSVSPEGAGPIKKERIQEEQEELPDNVMEGIIPESQEEKPSSDVNGGTETQYLEYQEDREERHLHGPDEEKEVIR